MTRACALCLSSIFVLAILWGIPVGAQSPFDDALFSFSLFPKHPRSGSKAEIEIVGYVTDLKRADIAWYVDGALKKSGVGERKFVFETGSIGTQTEIDVVMKQTNGIVVRKSITVWPADIDFIWEAEGYTPPFYRGKPHYVDGSKVRVIAMPSMTDQEGKRVTPKNLIYKWEQDGKFSEADSGFGRNVFNFIARRSLLASAEISVEASTVDSGAAGNGKVGLIPHPLVVAIYEKSPLYGALRNKELSGDWDLKTSEITLEVVPYFASTPSRAGGLLRYSWTLNNEPVGEDKPEITLRKPPEGAGVSIVRAVVKHPLYFAQSVGADLSIQFSK